jgi:hypothetical protein
MAAKFQVGHKTLEDRFFLTKGYFLLPGAN